MARQLIGYYFEQEPWPYDMTGESPEFVAMAISLGMVADPDYRYELVGFSQEELAAIHADLDRRMAE